MSKQKIKSISLGEFNSDYQTIFVNGECFSFNVQWSTYTVLDKLSERFDFSYQDEEEFARIW